MGIQPKVIYLQHSQYTQDQETSWNQEQKECMSQRIKTSTMNYIVFCI